MPKLPKPKDIDSYISQFPADVQAVLEKVRVTISHAAPDASRTEALDQGEDACGHASGVVEVIGAAMNPTNAEHALAGVWKDRLIARLGPAEGAGRPMRNWVAVEPGGVEDDDQLKDWIERAIKFVGKLPRK
jgi:hypothetical protein